MAITTPRGKRQDPPADQQAAQLGQLRAELAEARAEISQLRDQLRAVARLAIGTAVTAAPATAMAPPPRTVKQACLVHGVGENHAALIDQLFA